MGGCGQRHAPATLPPCQSQGEHHDRSAWVWKTENLLPRIGVRTPDRQIRRHTDYSFPVPRFQRTATSNRPKYNKIPNTVRPETILTNPVRQIFIFCAFWLYRPLVKHPNRRTCIFCQSAGLPHHKAHRKTQSRRAEGVIRPNNGQRCALSGRSKPCSTCAGLRVRMYTLP